MTTELRSNKTCHSFVKILRIVSNIRYASYCFFFFYRGCFVEWKHESTIFRVLGNLVLYVRSYSMGYDIRTLWSVHGIGISLGDFWIREHLGEHKVITIIASEGIVRIDSSQRKDSLWSYYLIANFQWLRDAFNMKYVTLLLSFKIKKNWIFPCCYQY